MPTTHSSKRFRASSALAPSGEGPRIKATAATARGKRAQSSPKPAVGRTLAALAIPASILVIGAPVHADLLSISDGGDTALINTQTGSGATGVTSLTINGQQQIGLSQDYFYSFGGAASPVESLALDPDQQTVDEGNQLFVHYVGSYPSDPSTPVDFEVDYTLIAGTNSASLHETITASLPSESSVSVPLQVLQYSNFHVGGLTDNTVTISGGNTADQTSGDANLAETVEVGDSDINSFDAGQASDIFSEVEANPSPLGGTLTATGDVASAFQFTQTQVVNNDTDGIISPQFSATNIITVPEPASAGLLAGGTLMLFGRRRLRARLSTARQ